MRVRGPGQGSRLALVTDVVLVAALLAWGQSEVWNDEAELLVGPAWANAVAFAFMSLVLLVRRRAPVWCLVLQCAAMGLLVATSGGTTQSLGWVLPLVAGVYAVAAYAPRRRLLSAAAPMAALLGLELGVDAADGNLAGADLLGSIPFYALMTAGWLWGTFARTRRLYIEQLGRNADLLVVQREERAHRRAVEERNRIARELHDVLAHGLTVTVRQAEAGEARLDHQPEAARASFEAIAETGRRSLTDVRRLIELLGEPDSEPSAAGGLDDLQELTASLSTAGLAVDLQRSGDLAEVPAAVAAAAYRIVQEALTNALRHGAARTARVVLHGEPGRLQLDITDDGRGVEGPPEPGGGLTGMRARAALCGGSLALGTPSGGGFNVSVSLPWEQ